MLAGHQVPRVDWSMVGGQEEAKLRLRQCVEWPLKYAATLKRFNVAPSRGILLYGPPGCSKTTLGERNSDQLYRLDRK